MAITNIFFLALLVLASVVLGSPLEDDYRSPSSRPSCKCLYGEQCFPNREALARFNESIAGRLIALHPAAFACHDPNFEEQACNDTRAHWSDSEWRSNQPGALESPQYETYGNETCFITSDRKTPCYQGSVPVYAVNVSCAFDVQLAIRFARFYNLRLVVKNTGHDYFGKSTGRGALSLWMHNLKNIEFIDYNQCDHSSDCFSAVKVGAGVQWREVYSAMEGRGVVVVGATSATVGAAGGWWQGGGHSNLAPTYGLGADNIVEFEVVTADGSLVVANKCKNRDLFWAMRGGGGGTFGVAISATHRTYRAPLNILSGVIGITANDSSSFQELLTQFAIVHPSLTDAGWAGTFNLDPHSMFLRYISLNKNVGFVNSTFQPLWDFVNNHSRLQFSVFDIRTYANFTAWFDATLCSFYPTSKNQLKCVDRVGMNRAIGSRLIPRSVLEENPHLVGQMLVKVLNTTNRRILGLSVAGGAVSNPKVSNAVNGAWRRAIWHLITGIDWVDGTSKQLRDADAQELTTATKIMIDVTPGSGAYINEADYNEPNWQQSFFGDKYPDLKAIKDKRDPTGLFVCRHCVGSEEWDEDLKCPISKH